MKTFYVGIKGVIIKDNKVLLIKAADGKGFWETPGGRIDDQEAVHETLHRELKEELSNIHNVEIHEILDAYRVPRDIDGGKSLVLVFYRVTADFVGNPELSHEHTDWKWVKKDEALRLVHESCKVAIQKAFETKN
jgi:8-oxo-dGTP diphosphatase